MRESSRFFEEIIASIRRESENIAKLREELAAELDEYLSFRHVFRNIYGFELKGERLVHLAEKFPQVSEKFQEEAGLFLKALSSS